MQEKEQSGLSKDTLSLLCELATCERDKKLIKYAALTSSDLTGTQLKKMYGISDPTATRLEVEEALDQVKEIHDAVEKLASVQERCVLESLGIVDLSEDSDDDDNQDSSEEECDDLSDFELDKHTPDDDPSNSNSEKSRGQEGSMIDPDSLNKNVSIVSAVPSHEHLLYMLRENGLNWFSFATELKLLLNSYSSEVLNQALVDFAHFLSADADITEEEDKQIEQSRQAFLLSERLILEHNNDINSESESDDPEDYAGVRFSGNLTDPALQKLVKRKRNIIKRKKRRHFNKLIAEKAILKRKVPPRASKLLKNFPNLGKDIDEFVRDNRVGADAWRRTGVATFDGNLKSGNKVTYQRIKDHLEKKYNTRFSYGSIVQLSVVKNKRRKSSSRYWGAANIRSRRARKGFNVRLNIDAHWSAAFYKGLDMIQLKDGRDKCIVNRDDAAGFRLDTTFTHKQHPALSATPEITTRTNYVNKYSSILQTTSYLFPETETTAQSAAGVVKPHVVFPKNPAQHATDILYLEQKEELKPCFENKIIDCIRVDGATDEGVSHKEVQFMWTERHLEKGKVCTLVTTRCSGSSYLNRVELQNGCLAVAHSNLFIPSTLHGSNFTESGGIDNNKLERNLLAATDVYISRCDKAPFGSSHISLFKGFKNDMLLTRRPKLLTFLKGSKDATLELEKQDPQLFEYFNDVWNLRNRHMVKNLPSRYVFQLLPCYEAHCPHQVCKSGKPEKDYTWYHGGPPLSYLPIPIFDPERPWGCKECGTCTGHCSGHYLSPEKHLKHYNLNGSTNYSEPPSSKFTTLKGTNEEIAKTLLISSKEVEMWNAHREKVAQARKSGAKKAAATRKAKKQTGNFLLFLKY